MQGAFERLTVTLQRVPGMSWGMKFLNNKIMGETKGPSAIAGLMDSDYITHVDGVDVNGKPLAI